MAPDSAAVKITGKLINRTPLVHSFLYFANIAVHSNANYQVIFPPGTDYVTNHAKKEFSQWPLADVVYNGIDFRGGVDVSWWKNHPSPVSMFAWGEQGGFVAGYDHGRQAGTVHIGDEHTVVGKKFFTWGAGSEGKMWDDILTDKDGPYIELMAGAYSDNQPDYTWIQPYETRTFVEYLYPVQKIGGVKSANREGAMNVQRTAERQLRVSALVTSPHAQARLRVEARGKVLLQETVSITPDRPYSKNFDLPSGIEERDVSVVLDSRGKQLIAYRPAKDRRDPMPEVVTPPPPPARIATTEELYFAGQRLEQFRNAGVAAEPYYEEVLKRDPNDVRTNTAVAIRMLKRGVYREAENHLRRALNRSTKNYTTPKDGEAHYYLGLALRYQGKAEAARAAFFKATWMGGWQAAAWLQVAQIAAELGDLNSALDHVSRSLTAHPSNPAALNLKAAILSRLNDTSGALAAIKSARAIDPLDDWAEYQGYLLRPNAAQLARLRERVRMNPQPAFEIASDFGSAGLWQSAAAAISLLKPENSPHPMFYFDLGYIASRNGQAEKALEYYRMGSTAAPAYSFPFRLEEIEVLEDAVRKNPRDARAHYYLGNVLADKQPVRAIAEWEQSRDLDPQFALAHRNLAFGYARVRREYSKAAESMKHAVMLDPGNPRFLLELDQLLEASGVPPAERLKALEKHQQVAALRDDSLLRHISLLVQVGRQEEALRLLTGHHFHMWEGVGRWGIYPVYVAAHLARGHQFVKAGQHAEALAAYRMALEYPKNLGTPQPLRSGLHTEIHYWIAKVHEALGDKGQAQSAYRKAVEKGPVLLAAARPAAIDQPDGFYVLALSLQKLGRQSEAHRIFEQMRSSGRDQLEDNTAMDFFIPYGEPELPPTRIAQAHYAIALSHLGGGNRSEAEAEFEKVLQLRPYHPGTLSKLSSLRDKEKQ